MNRDCFRGLMLLLDITFLIEFFFIGLLWTEESADIDDASSSSMVLKDYALLNLLF